MAPSLQRPVSMSASWSRSGRARAQLLEQKDARREFADLLRRAFPGCRSENELCEVASVALECSPSMVRNWLRCTHDAKVTTVWKVFFIAKVELVLSGGGRP